MLSFRLCLPRGQLSVVLTRGCHRTDCPFGLSTAHAQTMGTGEPRSDAPQHRPKPRPPSLLVHPTILSPFCTRSNLQSPISNLQFTNILFIGNDHSFCPDRRNRCPRRMGNSGLQLHERSVRRRTPLGDKHIITVLHLAFFTQKSKIICINKKKVVNLHGISRSRDLEITKYRRILNKTQ